MKIHLLKLKAELKVLAHQIKSLKPQRKQLANGYVPGLAATQHEFRYKHIAYCLLRGRTPDPRAYSPSSIWTDDGKQFIKLMNLVIKLKVARIGHFIA